MKKLILYTLLLILITNNTSINSMSSTKHYLYDGMPINELYGHLDFSVHRNWSLSEDTKIRIIKEALRKGADINHKYDKSKTLLMISADRGFKNIVDFLLTQPGIDLNSTDNDGNTAFMIAANSTNLDILNMLLNSGANINIQNIYNQNPLHLAIMGYKTDRDREIFMDAVLKAAKEQIPNQFYEFINQRSNNNQTPLSSAIDNCQVELVKKLIEAGADPSITNQDGQTAYTQAKDLLNTDETSKKTSIKLEQIIKILDEHKNKVKQKITEANIFCPSNIPGLTDIITEYLSY